MSGGAARALSPETRDGSPWEVMMTTTFDQRERAFETKFAQDEALRFKANARRNRMLGLWAAKKLGLVGTDAESYARELVRTDVDNPGSDGLFEKVSADFASRDIIEPDDAIRRMMEEFTRQASAEIRAGK
jgi:hypothetical protein